MQISPRNDDVVILVSQKQREERGIIIPEEQQDVPSRGVVVAIGPDPLCDDLEVGQEVLFAQYSGDTVVLNGEEYCCVRQESVRAILLPE